MRKTTTKRECPVCGIIFLLPLWKSKIKKTCSKKCGYKLIVLRWSKFPELRYQINNGITLCHFHHPRAMEEEKRLIPTFEELVSVSSE